MPNAPIRVLVVDDELLGRERIVDLLAHEQGVEVIGTADNGAVAIDAIRSTSPDLVFLDVQMPGKTGLDVVREIGADKMPATIFVTAFDQYALRAFELAALDYLVKPFDDERFEQAFRRARQLIELRELGKLREQLLAVLQQGPTDTGTPRSGAESSGYLERIAVEMRGKVRVVPVEQIDYITADGPYAELHTGDKTHLIREAMHTLEERLDPRQFVRIHRSAIVRLQLVDTLLRGAGGDYEVQLKSGLRLPVSRSRREELEKRLGVMP
ncbi:MAG TPA: LytTR family DNA-binding domain-containing protein [Gemmatimonadaceae bacterium]|nr:LytTR family DNA-binding domain-containing protein [Gemmatimonadaceae bacterium]